jgi:hypothetical protein
LGSVGFGCQHCGTLERLGLIQRIALEALGKGIEHGTIEECDPPLAAHDPILRAFARKRIRSALRDAGLLTAVQQPLHLLRVAFLIVARRHASSDHDDVERVAREQLELRRSVAPPRRGRWLSTTLLAGLLIAFGSVAVILDATRAFDPRASAAGSILSGPVSQHLVALSRSDSARLERARSGALDGIAEKAFGEQGTAKLGELLAAAESLAEAKSSERLAARDGFLSAAENFNHLLDQRSLPYFLDADVLVTESGPMPLLVSFYIERDVSMTSNDKGVRAIHLWRLDKLNFRHNFLGYTRPRTPAAMVLLDQIETDLVRHVLPAIPPDEPMVLVDERTEAREPAWAVELSRRAGQLIRRHFERVPPDQIDGVENVGRLLARRRALVRKWRAEVRGLGFELVVPERLVPENDYVTDLENRVPRSNLIEWQEIHESLMSRDGYNAFLRLRNRYVWSVERHEVQHRLDYARELVPVPEILAKRLGVENPIGVEEGSLPARARDELSAYLASIAQANDSPLLELVLLARFLFDETNLGGPYSYAALAAYEGIGKELGLDADALLGVGPIGRERLTRLFYAVNERPSDEIRAAASRFYRSAYGQELPTVEVRSSKANPEWRH